jgi:hypothetical protein
MRRGKRIALRLSDFGDPRSLSRRFRAKRMDLLLPILEEIAARRGSARIIDLGGTARFWSLLPRGTVERLRLSITLVNLPGHLPSGVDAPFTAMEGDACALHGLADQSFDLVHSNSVIEHVGDWARMRAFAHEARRLAPRHFIQTPDWAFPIEPHCMAPFFHWMPKPVRIEMCQRFALGHWRRATSPEEAERMVDSARLLSFAQMAELFPNSTIVRERFLGLSKSLIAIGGSD